MILFSDLENNADESVQLQTSIEKCQILVMSNEDTLADFPIRHAIPALVYLHLVHTNFDMINHACWALTYMMDALAPFFAIVKSNCCQNLYADELHYLSGSIRALACRITQHDKKSVASNCIAFSRLVDSFYGDRERLLEVASSELLANLQQLLIVSPPVLLSATYIMCAHCPELTIKILKQDTSHTLCLLLMGPPARSATPSTPVSPVVETPSPVKEYDHQVRILMSLK